MSEIKDGGPAFGQVVELRCVRVEMNGSTEWEPEAMTLGGLSVRDYLAAKAMASYLMPAGQGQTWAQRSDFEYIAETAYLMADAMLRARQS